MGTTQPIRDKEGLKKFVDYYKVENPKPRDYALVVFGLHTALRISDILNLQWREVYDFEKQCFLDHIFIQERKTGKQNVIPLNQHVEEALAAYKMQQDSRAEDYIFSKRTNHKAPIHRTQAYRIVRQAAQETLQEPNISCHSLRKTFGYHAWKQGTPPALLMDIYNHSSYQVTKRYLGIRQDERDAVYLKIDL